MTTASAERERRRAARALLLVRRAAPVEAEVRRQHLAGDLLDARDRLARAERPARAWPKIFTAGRLLKRSSESGPDV